MHFHVLLSNFSSDFLSLILHNYRTDLFSNKTVNFVRANISRYDFNIFSNFLPASVIKHNILEVHSLKAKKDFSTYYLYKHLENKHELILLTLLCDNWLNILGDVCIFKVELIIIIIICLFEKHFCINMAFEFSI
jgi:hypothetical protein